jgi:hypothetical protein
MEKKDVGGGLTVLEIRFDPKRINLYKAMAPGFFTTDDVIPPEWIRVVETVKRADMVIPEEVWDFIDSLLPDDTGEEKIGGLVVRFEGFTGECWDDAEKKGKSIGDLEREILREWYGRHGKEISSAWLRDPEFGEDNVFWAIYPRKVSASRPGFKNRRSIVKRIPAYMLVLLSEGEMGIKKVSTAKVAGDII